MKNIIINGLFLQKNITGIERYAREMCEELDRIIDETYSVILVTPTRIDDFPNYENIKIINTGKLQGIAWEQIELRKYLRKNKNYICLNFCNTTPLFVQPGITFIHDIMCKVNPSHFPTFKSKLSCAWHKFQYWYICKHDLKVCTVSNYSKKDIEENYKSAKGKIEIVSCGWQHFNRINSDDAIIEKLELKPNEYFFSLGNRSYHKNYKWILEAAKQNKNLTFVVTGKRLRNNHSDSFLDEENCSNLIFTGYLTDGEIKALMKNCKAFIQPSLYEGFGLPPMEAMSTGAKCIVSNVTSLPEVYEKSVWYIDPTNYENINLNEIMSAKIEPNEFVLDKFSWEQSAKKLKTLIDEL